MATPDDLATDVADALVTLMGGDRTGITDAEAELDASGPMARPYVAVATAAGPYCLEVHQGDTLPRRAPTTGEWAVILRRLAQLFDAIKASHADDGSLPDAAGQVELAYDRLASAVERAAGVRGREVDDLRLVPGT